MLKARLLRTVGIAAVVGVALVGSSDLLLARSQTGRGNGTRLASLQTTRATC
jgi:hypothetical protein